MIALLLLSLTGFAQDNDSEGKIFGQFRLIGSTLSDFDVNAEGTQLGQETWLDARLRIGAKMPFFIGDLETEWEVNTPQLMGDMWEIPGLVDERQRDARMMNTLPRKLNLTGFVGNYQVSAGLTTSHWGLGMLANDGAHPDWWGRSDFGDRVIRLRATRLPYYDGPPKKIELFTTAALDMVVGDEIGRLDNDQLAFQAIFSMLWKHRNESQWGAYTVIRHQLERDRSRSTTALALDMFGDADWKIGNCTLRTAAEGAVIVGSTDRATTYGSRNAQRVAQVGATGLLELENQKESLMFRLRAGYASGDANSDDGTTSDFAFDRDFSAGVVMFDQLNGGIEAATYNHLTDPDISGQPPDGVDALVTEGAFRRATFVQPAIQFKPISWMAARVGTTLAWATAPVSQPFYSYRAGGVPHNHLNVPSEGRHLGTELNWSIAFEDLGSQRGRSTQLQIQLGHLFVGEPMKAGGGAEVIHHAMGIVRTNW